jgi:hypothetical protein
MAACVMPFCRISRALYRWTSNPFSKLEKMHDIVIGLFVNRYEFCVLV